MKWRSRRVSLGSLIFLAALGIAVMALVEFTKVRVKKPFYDEKVAAAKLTQKAASTLKNAAGDCIVIDPVVDPNGTGLIGEQFTIITTDQGNLTAKLTTTNPNLAAVVVDMLHEAGVERGEPVAVAFTGSMPALNIAVLAAIETIGARPVIISSVGASMWGANNPQFTWLDMEKALYDKGIFKSRSIAASLGGRGDRGGNVSPEGRKLLREIIARDSVQFLESPTLDEAIEKRVALFEEQLGKGEKFAAYINVGGGLGSIGSAQNLVILRPGLNKRLPRANFPRKGAMIRFGEMGVPIINLSNVNYIAKKYGLPIAPEPMPDIPHGEVYSELRYRLWLAVSVLVVYLIAVFVVIRIDIANVLFKRKH